jgi:hypothetical protein
MAVILSVGSVVIGAITTSTAVYVILIQYYGLTPQTVIGDAKCDQVCMFGLSNACPIFLILVFFLLIPAIYGVRFVKDNFFLREQLISLVFLLVFAVLWVLMFLGPDSVISFLLSVSVPFMFLISMTLTITHLFLPWLRTYSQEFSDANSILERKSQVVETPKTIEEKLNRADLLKFISTQDGFAIFQDFLVGEFAVESLWFWRDVQNFKKAFVPNAENSVSHLQLLEDIFLRYLEFDAPLSVNIPSGTRLQLLNRFEDIKADKDAPLPAGISEIFKLAENDVVFLMQTDPWLRFRQRRNQKKSMANLAGLLASRFSTNARFSTRTPNLFSKSNKLENQTPLLDIPEDSPSMRTVQSQRDYEDDAKSVSSN